MVRLLEWETSDLGYMGMEVPDHTRESLESYFIRGWMPGGFLEAMLAGDLYRAINNADTANRQMMWAIGRWIMHCAPPGSWGSYEAVDNWVQDLGECRSTFAKDVEQKAMWKVLQQ